MSMLLPITYVVTFAFLSASILLTLFRLFRGPSLPDRVIAVDLLGIIAVSFMALYCLLAGQAVYLDAAVALALIAFLGTVAFARFVEQDARKNARETSP